MAERHRGPDFCEGISAGGTGGGGCGRDSGTVPGHGECDCPSEDSARYRQWKRQNRADNQQSRPAWDGGANLSLVREASAVINARVSANPRNCAGWLKALCNPQLGSTAFPRRCWIWKPSLHRLPRAGFAVSELSGKNLIGVGG